MQKTLRNMRRYKIYHAHTNSRKCSPWILTIIYSRHIFNRMAIS